MPSTIQKTLFNGILLILLSIAIIIFISSLQSKKVQNTSALVAHTQEVLYHTQKTFSLIKSYEGSTNKYAITGDTIYIKGLGDIKNSINKEVSLLRQLTFRIPYQQVQIDSLIIQLQNQSNNSSLIISDKNSNKNTKAYHQLLLGKSKNIDDHISAIIKNMEDEEMRLLNERKKDNNKALQNLYYLLYLVLGLIGVIAVLIMRKFLIGQQILKAGETQFRSLIEAAPDAMIVTNEKAEIVIVNHQTEKTFGYSSKEIIGERFERLLPNEFKEEFKILCANYIRDKKDKFVASTIELTAEKKDGNQFSIEMSISPFKTEKGIWICASIRDITERKLLEQKLTNFNQKLETEVIEKNKETKEIFERVSDAFVALDKNWNYTYVNDIAYESFNRPKGSLVGKNIWEEFPEGIGQPFYHAYHKAMETQQFVRLEEDYLPWDRWFENSIYPSPNGLSIYFKDITEKKKAEQLIIKEKELSDTIINSLPGIFYLYDESGKFLRWNKNFETISGYSALEISQMNPLDFFVGEEKKLLEEKIKQVFTEGKAEVEANFFTKQKEKVPYFFNGQLIQYENQSCLIGVGIDISERKKTEDKLKKSEEKYKLLFDNNPLPMWMIDVNTLNIIDVNEAATKHYGYTREQFLNLNIRNIRPPEDIQRLEEATKLQDESIRNVGVWTHVKRDGTLIKVEITSHDINYQNLKTRLILSNDVTDKINAEQALTELNKELRKLYAHQQEIREEERKHIAREIHDELGQIITGVKMDISWLRKKLNTTDPVLNEKLDESIFLLDEAVKTVRKISTELRPSILDDLGLIAALQWQSHEFEKRTNITCSFTCNVEEIDLQATYQSNIFRIYQETLTNILRHSQASQVNANLQLSNQLLTLTIKDNGKGFNSVTQTNTLGLLGMKERAIMLNGKFYIISKIGEGTECKLVIPII